MRALSAAASTNKQHGMRHDNAENRERGRIVAKALGGERESERGWWRKHRENGVEHASATPAGRPERAHAAHSLTPRNARAPATHPIDPAHLLHHPRP